MQLPKLPAATWSAAAVMALQSSILLSTIRLASSDKYCGVDADDASDRCWQQCGSNDDCCSMGLSCFETGSDCPEADAADSKRNYCGTSWCDASYNCGTPCVNGTNAECPDEEFCYASTPCNADDPGATVPLLPSPPSAAPRQYCGNSLENAQQTCWQPCFRGDSDCCLGTTCYDTGSDGGDECSPSDYVGSNHFYCGKSWCDASYTCTHECPDGSNDECPVGEYCYANVPCDASIGNTPPETILNTPPRDRPSVPISGPAVGDKYCGTSAGDAISRCWQSCGSDSDCCFGQSCYETSCGPPFYDGPNHAYCGTSFCDAVNKCNVPCPNGNECPSGQNCFDNTPCDSFIPSTQPYYCGLGIAEAEDKCWEPCPSQQDSECCFGQTCHNTGGSCLASIESNINHQFCGTDLCDASYKCTQACPGGDDSDCPPGETCFLDTPCTSPGLLPVFRSSYCGQNETDAAGNCWQPCLSDGDCCFGQLCFASARETCGNPNFQGGSHFFCGDDFCDAAFTCGTPCPSGYDLECPGNTKCFANTPCDSAFLSFDSAFLSFGLPKGSLKLISQFRGDVAETPNGAAQLMLMRWMGVYQLMCHTILAVAVVFG